MYGAGGGGYYYTPQYAPPIQQQYPPTVPLQYPQQYAPQLQYAPPQPLQYAYAVAPPPPTPPPLRPELQYPAQEQYRPPPSPTPVNCTRIYGIIIGLSKDGNANYLFYSQEVGGLAYIDKNVKELHIGRWLQLVVQSPEFHGEFILDNTNCVGFEIRDTLPDPMYASAKFYPSRHDPNNGELIITARFSIHANHQTMKFDVHSYDIEFLHIIDDFQMIKGSDQFYDGRSFIVEAQASLGGWLVLRVHEDSNRQFSCDALLYPIIDFNVQFLEDCCPALIPIMTGDGWPHPPQGAPQQPVFHEEAGHFGEIHPSSSANSYLAPSQIELQEITESMSATSISQQAPPTTQMAPPPPPQPTVDVTGDSDEEIDDEDSEGTMGTATIPAKEYMKDVAGKMYQRLIDERPLTGQTPQSALCVVVQQIDKCALLYTAKRDVQNVLLYEKKCEGLPNGRSLELGTIAFFEILPRLMETQDELLPRAPYSHIAVRMKPSTPESLEKIARFQQKVRCFGGLIEMKVRIALTQPNTVSIYHPKDEELVNGDDKTFYYLKATNGVIVSIPSERLEPHLDANFQAEFDLIAWVTYRKAIGKVQMHIGRNGEASRKWTNGRIDELPPLSANSYLMNVTKRR